MTRSRHLLAGLDFPEGPAFDEGGNLWVVDLKAGRLWRWKDGKAEAFPVSGRPNGLASTRDGRLVYCDAEGDALVAWAGSETDRLLEGARLGFSSPNDLAFDACSNLVFTCPAGSRTTPTGEVWVLPAAGGAKRIAQGLYFPNGLCFSADGSELFVAETYRRRIWRGLWDARAQVWTDARPWVHVGGEVGPDGMALGEDGSLYVAVYGSEGVWRIAPEGVVTLAVRTAGPRPTNCAFDPRGRLGLVVTEAETGTVTAYPEIGRGARLFAGSCRNRLVGDAVSVEGEDQGDDDRGACDEASDRQ